MSKITFVHISMFVSKLTHIKKLIHPHYI